MAIIMIAGSPTQQQQVALATNKNAPNVRHLLKQPTADVIVCFASPDPPSIPNGDCKCDQRAVFKITLPCSGKVTDETDVQVLINISGLVPADEFGQAAGEEPLGGQDQLVAEQVAQLARAEQQSASGANSTNVAELAASGMLADEAELVRPTLRPVAHTLAIKRKKICTVAPLPVHGRAIVRPSTQPRLEPHSQPVPALGRPTVSSTTMTMTTTSLWAAKVAG